MTKEENIAKAKEIIRDNSSGKGATAEVNAGTPPARTETYTSVNWPIQPQTQSITAVQVGIVEPLVSIDKVKQAWAKWQAMKSAVVDAGDIQPIVRNGKKEAYIKKSGWRKIQVAYGIRTEILDHERTDQKGMIFHNYQVRATSPGGSYAEAIGSCNSGERQFAHGESDIMMTAQTRATNRAISDLVGGGDVSAEEME